MPAIFYFYWYDKKYQFLLSNRSNFMEAIDLNTLHINPNQGLQKQIHHQLVEWICSGRLPVGTKLPSSRQLAHDLQVSRNTISLVFEQLKAEGFIETYQGKGVYIATELPIDNLLISTPIKNKPAHLPPISQFAQSLQQNRLTTQRQTLPFTLGIPDLQQFPTRIWNQIQRCHQDRSCLMGYDDGQGYQPLREAIADYLKISRGVRCHAEQVIITHGAQQGISLCSLALLDEDDHVLLENPCYLGAKKAFKTRHIAFTPIPLVDQCIDINYLFNKLLITAKKPRLLYTTPTHQYPLGGMLSAGQRLKLLDWAYTEKIWIIEDDYDSEFHFTHKPIAALQGMTSPHSVIYLGSFSKTLFPSLRLGYLVVPEELVEIFVQTKNFMTGESPLLNQAVVADFIAEGHFIRHLRKMRKLYKEKWIHLESLIKEKLQGLASPIAESAGMHLAIEIADCDDVLLQKELLKQGFGCAALSQYYIGEVEKTGLVLGFANTTTEQRIACIEYIRMLLITSH